MRTLVPRRDCCEKLLGGYVGRVRDCPNAAVVELNGKFYCGVHDPKEVEERKARGDAKHKELMSKYRLQARAPAMKEVLEAIRDRCSEGVHQTDQVTGKTFYDLIQKVLDE